MFCRMQRTGTKSNLSDGTVQLVTKRREYTQATSCEQSLHNKQIAKIVRRNLRSSNVHFIEKAIDRSRWSEISIIAWKEPPVEAHCNR